MYKFLFYIVTYFIISVNAHSVDVDVGLRCDETYSISNLCYPKDATLKKDGSCKCPIGGCIDGCSTADGVKDYFCYNPINVLDRIADRKIDLGFKATAVQNVKKSL